MGDREWQLVPGVAAGDKSVVMEPRFGQSCSGSWDAHAQGVKQRYSERWSPAEAAGRPAAHGERPGLWGPYGSDTSSADSPSQQILAVSPAAGALFVPTHFPSLAAQYFHQISELLVMLSMHCFSYLSLPATASFCCHQETQTVTLVNYGVHYNLFF